MVLAATAAFITASNGPVDARVKAGVDAWQRRDHAAAVSAWRPLADRGDPHAQFNLAQAYKLGRGVPVDMERAMALYRLAAAQGHREAGALLGLILFQRGQRAQAMPHIISAAESGEASAQYVYGTALFNGDVVGRNVPLAYTMMKRAADAGVPPAAAMLAEMDKRVPGRDRQRRPVPAGGTIPAGAEGTAVAASAPAPVRIPPTRKITAAPFAPAASVAASQPARGWRVQLGAFGQSANAHALFTRLKGPVGILGQAQPYLVRTGAVTRLQAGPFASRAAADGACRAIRAAGSACFAVAP